ncbi:uncharacterized protein RAG0_06857 [Rhynchosporium agropyri]|uniref:Uncharacterized protein n=1 Tax=Rhynchosporium agropyri TaxID=914238 RepID=A0A1E1KJ01_9HELO|nr:uncharacterized protein RAG0_06857 [Rhynchosporium agropyri]
MSVERGAPFNGSGRIIRARSGGATSTATAILFSPLTAGISLVGLGQSTPRIHNARKKRAIIEAKLQTHGQTPSTRKRDVIAPMAMFGTIGGLTLGLAGPGADLIAGEAAGKGAEYAAAQRAFPDRFYLLGMIVEFLKQLQSFHMSDIALDATGAIIEDRYDGHSKKKADQRMTVQYQDFQKQFIQEKAVQGIYIQPKPLGYQPAVAPDVLTQDTLQRQSLYQPGTQAYHPPCSTPLPIYPQSPDPSVQQYPNKYCQLLPSTADSKLNIVHDVFELPAELVTAAVPAEDSIPATPSMEDEILILKARILQMEIEKRGGVIDIVPAKNEPEVSHEDSASLQPALTIDVEEPAEHQDTQNKQNEQELAAELVTKEQTRKSPSSVLLS